ncbi:YitT family protein [[Clostridium] spiroforme]|nr:YitT family protein [Thomasclavelia spiroformis]MBM6880622.1 YitT family protein [Thomasclavelia spiroformis]MBM6931575.1 YitT family protein [Thomasclavelia spiroformis]
MKLNEIRKNKKIRFLITFVCVIAAAFAQAYVIQVFIRPSNLLSSGFTGVAILVEKITSTYFDFSFSTSLGMVLLNVPVAIICYKSISPKFTFFSLLEVFLASFFLKVMTFSPIFDDVLLNITFGGFAYGLATVVALKGNASTGGTDFIALYISNRQGKSIWGYVFLFNTMILGIFGSMFGWEYAGYSILFQFISTKTIDSFYHRYERVTLQITTLHPQEIIDCYIQNYRHGISKINAVGGYSQKEMALLHTVVSSYEVQDIVDLLRKVDSHIIVNVLKTENFFGGFYQAPLD